ncbi:hypothetical protein H4S02_002635, partial [Coemansia sp. RSA 2611]
MSGWESYIAAIKEFGGESSALVGKNGSVWFMSSDWESNRAENEKTLLNLVKQYANEDEEGVADPYELRQHGVVLKPDPKYKIARVDKESGFAFGKGESKGLVIADFKQGLLIGAHGPK